MEKPCEKYSASPFFRHAFSAGQTAFCAASETRYWMTVAFRAASSMGNSVLPGTQPSFTALSHSRLNSGACPMITGKPLSRMFSDWAGPCTP